MTSQRRPLSAIQNMHRQAGHHLDLEGGPFRKVWSGIDAPTAGEKSAMLTPALRNAVLPDSLTSIRDGALLLVGFAGALRRTELAAVEVSARDGANWIEHGADGLTVHLARSKRDQEGGGQKVGVPFGSNLGTCPVRAYHAWLEASKITEGPAFRQSTATVSSERKRYAIIRSL
ncbi:MULTISPECIES: hypothetical protein [unclassified Bradyrhizobium]|uniref:hypothetical protein n=1 Tax=unclassified Bradyrhizobium TaxID=2631580 RepID=UPI003398701C